ncbi:MAG: 30S ribosomal protein S16 [Candidatus Campbellbacteria bacterium]|nr:30S ribosomal protein S16 [Candidatus Campbellbacteria bacterium]
MLKIRLQRTGRKNNPSYRIIVVDSSVGPKSGKYIEKLGTYDSIRKTKSIEKERIQHWMNNGAEVSETVFNILVADGMLKGKKKNVLPKKTPIKKEVNEEKQEAGVANENKTEEVATQKAEGEVSAEQKSGEEKVGEEKAPTEQPQAEQKVEEATEQKPEETTEQKPEQKEEVVENKEATAEQKTEGEAPTEEKKEQ